LLRNPIGPFIGSVLLDREALQARGTYRARETELQPAHTIILSHL
jgi:hypothetical protein